MKDIDRIVFGNSFYAEVRVPVDGVAIEVPINQRKVNAISGRLGMIDKEIEAQKKAEAFLAKFRQILKQTKTVCFLLTNYLSQVPFHIDKSTDGVRQ